MLRNILGALMVNLHYDFLNEVLSLNAQECNISDIAMGLLCPQ